MVPEGRVGPAWQNAPHDDTAPPLRAASPRWSSRCWSPRAAPRLRPATPSASAARRRPRRHRPRRPARPRRARRPRPPSRRGLRPGQAPPESPAPDANDPTASLYAEIEARSRQLRGLTPTSPSSPVTIDEAGAARVPHDRASRRTTPPSSSTAPSACSRPSALLPQDASLRDLYLELLTSQVAGLLRRRRPRSCSSSPDGRDRPGREGRPTPTSTPTRSRTRLRPRDAQRRRDRPERPGAGPLGAGRGRRDARS